MYALFLPRCVFADKVFSLCRLPRLSPSTFPPPTIIYFQTHLHFHLERIILRRNLSDKVIPNHRHLLQYILPNLRYFAEEKDRKRACCYTKTGGNGAVAHGFRKGEAPEVREVLGSGFGGWISWGSLDGDGREIGSRLSGS
jgi:hypothetical protein